MLDQLVISRDQTKERTKFGGFMLSTGIVMVAVLMTGMVVSLFNQNIALAADGLEISTLVMPVPLEPEKAPILEQQQQNNNSQQKDQSQVPMRTENVLRIEETPTTVPDKVSVVPSDVKSRPFEPFVIGPRNSDPVNNGSNRNKSTGSEIGGTTDEKVIANNPGEIEKETIPPPIVVKKPPMVSGGVVNGKAINLVTPSYSQAAKSLGIKGAVRVQVVIDEEGRVISANAVSGHPLLSSSAVDAAKRSTFSPTTLSKQKVKVTGIIVYNFA